MVAHPEVGVGLDRVAGQGAQAGPAVEGAGVAGDHGGHRVAGAGRRQFRPQGGRLGVEDGIRGAAGREVHGVRHLLILARRALSTAAHDSLQ